MLSRTNRALPNGVLVTTAKSRFDLEAEFSRTAKRKNKKNKAKRPRKKARSEPDDYGMAKVFKPDRLWIEQRMEQLGFTQSALGSKTAMGKEGVNRTLAGTRIVKGHEVAELASALQTSVGEMLHRLGLAAQGGLTLTGRVLADGRVSPVVDTSSGPVQVLTDYPIGVHALLVEAPSGPLSAWDGAVLVYQPSTTRTVGPDIVGRLCVIEDAAEPMPIVGVLGQATGARENRRSRCARRRTRDRQACGA